MAFTSIDDPSVYFQIKLYAGDASATAHTLDGDTDLQPDVAWFKCRTRAENHRLVDALRGTNSLKPNTNGAEVDSGSDGFTSLDSDGFTLSGDGGGGEFNASRQNYVAWCWKESATAGFDIVSFTGNGTARTISHSLSAVPKILLVKNRSVSNDWNLYHHSTGNTHRTIINNTTVKEDTDSAWNDTTPTSSVFSVGTNTNVNQNTSSMIAYCWAEKQGFSKFGSYVGNGNADGTFVYTGFRPAFIIFKKSSGGGDDWSMYDYKRTGYNSAGNEELRPNTTAAEQDVDRIDILSNGFKARTSSGETNESGSTYVYMAWAKAPFVNSNGVPCNAR